VFCHGHNFCKFDRRE